MIKKLKKYISQSKDRKALVSNFSYLMLLQVTSYAFPLLTIPYLAHVIGVDGFGKIAFASAMIVWFQTITEWGFNYTATRDAARNRDNIEKISVIFSNVFWAKLLLALISFIVLFVLSCTIPYLKEHQNLILITFLLIPGRVLFPDWLFQAMEKMRFITIFDLISKAVFTLLIFIFIHQPSDYILQPLFLSLGTLCVGFFAMYIIIVRWGIKLVAPQWSEILNTLKNSKDVFINNIMPNLYNSFSSVLLGFLGGSSANGLLDAGAKFVSISQQFTNVISRVFFPFLARHSDKHHIYQKLHLLSSVILSIGLFLFAPLIIKIFFTPEFHQAVIVLRIMAFSLIFLSLSNIYGVNYMVIHGYEKQLRNITIKASILGFFVACPLVYFYSYLGAAITITLTRALLGFGIMYKAKTIQRSLP